MPRSGPPDDKQMREDMLEDGVHHLRDAAGCLGTVAQLTEDLGLENDAEWKAISELLESLVKRVDKLIKK